MEKQALDIRHTQLQKQSTPPQDKVPWGGGAPLILAQVVSVSCCFKNGLVFLLCHYS